MNSHKLTNTGLVLIALSLSVGTALKIAPTLSELKTAGLTDIIKLDPQYRALP